VAKAKRKPTRKRALQEARYATLGAHQLDLEKNACRYCGWDRGMVEANPGRCVRSSPRAQRALGRMLGRTPLRLTSEDEQIMREDWLLDPHNLSHVRIYQELLKMERENVTLRAQVTERDERTRELEENIESAPRLNERGLVTVGKAESPRIRRMSRAQNVWPAELEPGEVLLATEIRAGVEYAFIARDAETSDWACRELAHSSDYFPWLMRESTEGAS
jgi:hypothetical protein